MSKKVHASGTIQHKCPLTGEWVGLVTVGTPGDVMPPVDLVTIGPPGDVPLPFEGPWGEEQERMRCIMSLIGSSGIRPVSQRAVIWETRRSSDRND